MTSKHLYSSTNQSIYLRSESVHLQDLIHPSVQLPGIGGECSKHLFPAQALDLGDGIYRNVSVSWFIPLLRIRAQNRAVRFHQQAGEWESADELLFLA